MTQNPLEMPQQMRDIAEKNVEQARTAYGHFVDTMTQAMTTWTKGIPENRMTSSFKAVQDRAIGFARQNAEAGLALAGDLAKSKDITDLMSMQSRFAQTQMQAYALQAQELGRLMTDAVQSIQSKP